jgi:ATP-dependent helicase Lhr and Lhr-like helicase
MPRTMDGLDLLLPVVARWFRTSYGTPTPAQRLGWPSIAAGRNTLILAPTGSGKTLAAFLACLDHLWRIPKTSRGVRVLYISPLKALNQDISRNLEFPLAGILRSAESEGVVLRALSVAVRSGDTSPADRQRLVRSPPDVLITTPESLHLMLTSRARETLRSVSHVIVDEIHALCPNKRGVFLSLLLERLEHLNPGGFVRIGLSATQRPLDEVARYLGGLRAVTDPDGRVRMEARPVTIVDTGQRKELDLEVIAPFEHAGAPSTGSVWPAIEQRLFTMIQAHRSTIVFANNRRIVERLTSHLNDLAMDDLPGSRPLVGAEVEGVEPATGADDLAKSHHGSLSLNERRSTEDALKRGELAAVVATASLELGIDMGAVELVCQVESPGSVSRGLQRVGRAGHLVGRVSKGRLIAKTASDLIESAALCRQMALGAVEPLRVPTGCLDVLAQQVVACVAVDRWEVSALFDLVRRAYPYRDLTPSAFESVLKMVSGRFPADSLRDLRARVSWDRVHNLLHALPGTSRIALVNGGTIPDTGQYPVYLGEGGPRLGELDEEFVLERRVGETFVLGTAVWRIEAIELQRVLVGRAEGQSAVMPFWRGEDSPRSAELGEAVGRLCREVVEGLDDPLLPDRLRTEYYLEAGAARALRDHIARQLRVSGAVPDDRTVLVETYVDPAGETGLAMLSPFGGKLHQALKLVFQARLRQRLGITAACLHGDDGLLFRLPQTDEPPVDLFDGLSADLAEGLIREELGDSALFGLRFRQNAGRALLMPRPDPSKRTPLWLQRLRAKDLLQVVRRFPDFPVVVETYRECLDDNLDLPRLRAFLDAVASGEIRVVTRRGEIPSPFVSDLIFRFEHHFLYEWDEPNRSDRTVGRSPVDDELLDPLLDPATASLWLDPTAVGRVESRLRGAGHPPRTAEEMAEVLRRLGDVAPGDLSGPMLALVTELEHQGRACKTSFPGTNEPDRWISVEERDLYEAAFRSRGSDRCDESSVELETIVRRFLQTHALIGLSDLTARYPIGPALATELLERWVDAGGLVRLEPLDGEDGARWADERNLAEVRRLSIAIRRKESVAVSPEVFADYLVRRQGLHAETRGAGSAAVARVLERLQGFAVAAELWESEILPGRLEGYRPSWLDEALGSGDWIWVAEAEARGEPRVAFLARAGALESPERTESAPPSTTAEQVISVLKQVGASFTSDLSRASGLEPSRVRTALEELLRGGQVTNDRFDPLRAGAKFIVEALTSAAAGARATRLSMGRARPSLRRGVSARPEGRWSRVVDSGRSGADPEATLLAWLAALLERYGVLTRETVALDPWAPSWRDLAHCLARAELRGEVRRGYFVEGLSGIQYASSEAADELAHRAGASNATSAPVLISTLDPANLYGSGAPLDIDLLEGGTARLPRVRY